MTATEKRLTQKCHAPFTCDVIERIIASCLHVLFSFIFRLWSDHLTLGGGIFQGYFHRQNHMFDVNSQFVSPFQVVHTRFLQYWLNKFVRFLSLSKFYLWWGGGCGGFYFSIYFVIIRIIFIYFCSHL